MVWSLILVCSRCSEASSKEEIFAKSKYLVEIEVEASFATNATICALQEGWRLFSWLGFSKKAMCTTKVSCLGSIAGVANSFFPTNLTRLVVKRASSIV